MRESSSVAFSESKDMLWSDQTNRDHLTNKNVFELPVKNPSKHDADAVLELVPENIISDAFKPIRYR